MDEFKRIMGLSFVGKNGVKCADVWYKEVPDEVRMLKDGNVEIWWDIHCTGITIIIIIIFLSLTVIKVLHL